MGRHLASRSAVTLAAIAGLVAGLLSAGALPASAGAGTYAQPDRIVLDDAIHNYQNLDTISIVPLSKSANVYPSTIEVPATAGTIQRVEVTLNRITHDEPDDLDVMLVSPTGQKVMLLSDAGGIHAVANVKAGFKDTAAASAPDSTTLGAGAEWKPTDWDAGGLADNFPAPAPDASTATTTLSSFNGSSPTGTWRLFVVDDTTNSVMGAVSGWELFIQTNASAPYRAIPSPSGLTVSGAPRGVTDVNVVLDGLSHTWLSNLDLMLIGPTGAKAIVLSDVAESGDASNATITLDDEATSPPPTFGADLVTDSFRPFDYDPMADLDAFTGFDMTGVGSALSVFDGTDPNGAWQLYAVDDLPGDRGEIARGWSLQLTTVDRPAAPVISAPGNGTYDADGAVALAGSAPANSPVRVYDGATAVANVTANASGAWSAALTGASTGTHSYTATSFDAYSNESPPSAVVTVTVDGTAPAGSVALAAGALWTRTQAVTLALSATDAGSGMASMRFSNDGTTWSAFVPYATSAAWTLTSGPGSKTVYAQFADAAGNVSAAVSDTITFDAVKPKVGLTRPATGADGVRVGKNIKAFFSEKVARATLTKTNVKLMRKGSTKAVRATLRYDEIRRKLVIDPKRALRPDTTYKVLIRTGVKDLAGNNFDQKRRTGLQPKRFRFTTR